MRRSAKHPPVTREQEYLTERALWTTFGVILPQDARVECGRGYSQPQYSREYTTDYWTLFALSRELAVPIGELVSQQRSSTLRRVERAHMSVAAGEIATCVQHMLPPVRAVLVLRGGGSSWPRVFRALPGRAHWSVREDWRAGLRRVWHECRDAVTQLQ